MLCGLLILAIVSFSARCNVCCDDYQCTLIDNQTLCGSKDGCKWANGACAGKACGDYTDDNDCVGSHYHGAYTKDFYCKWDAGACVAGTGACAEFDGYLYPCLYTGKCRYNGTNCLSASSCADFTDPLYINYCSYVNFNGKSCYKDGDTCKDFSCGLLTTDSACATRPNCYYTAAGACAPTTTCSAINGIQCGSKYDNNGNKCISKNSACKAFECSDLTDAGECTFEPGCTWSISNSVCGKSTIEIGCSTYSTEMFCSGANCEFIKSCPVDPNSSSQMIYVPALLVALLFVLLL